MRKIKCKCHAIGNFTKVCHYLPCRSECLVGMRTKHDVLHDPECLGFSPSSVLTLLSDVLGYPRILVVSLALGKLPLQLSRQEGERSNRDLSRETHPCHQWKGEEVGKCWGLHLDPTVLLIMSSMRARGFGWKKRCLLNSSNCWIQFQTELEGSIFMTTCLSCHISALPKASSEGFFVFNFLEDLILWTPPKLLEQERLQQG